MLLVETLKVAAILPQKSPFFTTYSMGGKGVRVGARVAVADGEGVMVIVAVGVIVTVAVGWTTCPVVRRTVKTTAAPMARIRTINPKATGRLKVTSGMRGPWIDFADSAAVGVSVRPHTRHRVAFSLTRVPQVGQTFVGVVDDIVIGGRYRKTGDPPAKRIIPYTVDLYRKSRLALASHPAFLRGWIIYGILEINGIIQHLHSYSVL
jgi:hypothetical protein